LIGPRSKSQSGVHFYCAALVALLLPTHQSHRNCPAGALLLYADVGLPTETASRYPQHLHHNSAAVSNLQRATRLLDQAILLDTLREHHPHTRLHSRRPLHLRMRLPFAFSSRPQSESILGHLELHEDLSLPWLNSSSLSCNAPYSSYLLFTLTKGSLFA
jgi:hypothetical protein